MLTMTPMWPKTPHGIGNPFLLFSFFLTPVGTGIKSELCAVLMNVLYGFATLTTLTDHLLAYSFITIHIF